MSDAFFQALQNLQPQKIVEPEFRLYYDPDSGKPLFYSTGDEPGTYIVVDTEMYAIGNYHCIIKNGKVVDLSPNRSYCKLVPADSGITTHSDNIMIISKTGKHWAKKIYDN